MESDALAVVPEATDATADELIAAVANARMAEVIAGRALQEARTVLGERQRAWQAAQDRTRLAMHNLKAHIDREAGIEPQFTGEPW